MSAKSRIVVEIGFCMVVGIALIYSVAFYKSVVTLAVINTAFLILFMILLLLTGNKFLGVLGAQTAPHPPVSRLRLAIALTTVIIPIAAGAAYAIVIHTGGLFFLIVWNLTVITAVIAAFLIVKR